MKKILIPTDFSDNAWNAIAYILAFCKNTPVTFVLVHIIPPDGIPDELDALTSYVTGDVLESHKILDKLASVKYKIVKKLHTEIHKIETVCIASGFITGIKKLIKKHQVDLIVMGTKGASPTSKNSVGKHTGEVITKIQCPLLVVPEKAVFNFNFNIAFPTDYDFIYKDSILNTLKTIASLHETDLKILRVANTKLPLSSFQLKNRAYLKDYLSKDAATSFHKVDHPDLEYGIQTFVDSMNIGMIAMIAKNLNFFQKLLFNPRVAKMSYYFKIPFLVLHE